MQSPGMYAFQQEVLDILISKIDRAEINEARVSEIAGFILDEFPDNLTPVEMEKKIFKLGTLYPELSAIVVTHGAVMEQEQKNEVSIKNVQNFIKEGKVEDATQMIKTMLKKYD